MAIAPPAEMGLQGWGVCVCVYNNRAASLGLSKIRQSL